MSSVAITPLFGFSDIIFDNDAKNLVSIPAENDTEQGIDVYKSCLFVLGANSSKFSWANRIYNKSTLTSPFRQTTIPFPLEPSFQASTTYPDILGIVGAPLEFIGKESFISVNPLKSGKIVQQIVLAYFYQNQVKTVKIVFIKNQTVSKTFQLPFVFINNETQKPFVQMRNVIATLNLFNQNPLTPPNYILNAVIPVSPLSLFQYFLANQNSPGAFLTQNLIFFVETEINEYPAIADYGAAFENIQLAPPPNVSTSSPTKIYRPAGCRHMTFGPLGIRFDINQTQKIPIIYESSLTLFPSQYNQTAEKQAATIAQIEKNKAIYSLGAPLQNSPLRNQMFIGSILTRQPSR